MINVSVNIAELRNFAKQLPQMREKVLDLMEVDIRGYASNFLSGLLNAELSVFLGRQKYERKTLIECKELNYRNGHYGRVFFIKGIGEVSIKMPRDRMGRYDSQVLARYQRVDERLKQDCVLMYLMGHSTRTVGLISQRILGRRLSHTEVSKFSQELNEKVETWRTRPIKEKIKYLYLDGTNFKMRVDKNIEKVCVLVVIGVNESNHKQVLALQAGDKESASTWRELFKDLKQRGLDKQAIELGIMDGLSGLEKVFKDEFPNADIQRCQVHVARNVLTKTPHSIQKQVADDMRSIFYASSKKKAKDFFDQFEKRWEKQIPSAVKCLRNNLDNTLTFYKFPDLEWAALRTTNVIERLNKEYKRRTKSMEIVAGEKSMYNLLAVISIKMEAYWKSKPIHFYRELPWMKNYFSTEENKFTQLC